MSDFKIGDVVRHKATGNKGPLLTVHSVDRGYVKCTFWKQADHVFTYWEFRQEELEKTDPPPENLGF